MVNWWLSWVSILTSETERRSWACACEREHICVYGSDNGRKHAGTPPRAGSPWPPHRRALSRCHRRPASKLTNQIFVGWPGKKSTWTWTSRIKPKFIGLDKISSLWIKIEKRRRCVLSSLPLNQAAQYYMENGSICGHETKIQDFFCLNLMPLQENRKNSSRKEKNQNQHAWNLKEKKKISSRLLLRSYSSK